MADWNCNLCKEYQSGIACTYCDNGSEFVKMTNADSIRAMSDEELAEFLDDLTDNCCRCAEHQNCGNCQIGLDAESGFCDIRKWIQSEAE